MLKTQDAISPTTTATSAFLSLLNETTGVRVVKASDKDSLSHHRGSSDTSDRSALVAPRAAPNNKQQPNNSSLGKIASKSQRHPKSKITVEPKKGPRLVHKSIYSSAAAIANSNPTRTDSAFRSVALHHLKAPLQLADLEDEDAEGVNNDFDIDPWATADLTWSDEAPAFKQHLIKTAKQAFITAAKERAQAKMEEAEQRIRKTGGGANLSHHPSATQISKGNKDEEEDTPASSSFKCSEKLAMHFFKTLRLVNMRISDVDEKFKQVQNLKELSLTGNLLTNISASNVPADIEILHLNANLFKKCPNLVYLNHLVHLGLGFNSINSLKEVEGFSQSSTWLPPTVISLDLTSNDLTDIEETLSALQELPSLKLLSLSLNPIYYLSGYRKWVVSRLPRLIMLDEINVSNSERSSVVNETQENAETQATSQGVKILIKLDELTGLVPTAQNPELLSATAAVGLPPDEIQYCIHAQFPEYTAQKHSFAISEFSHREEVIEVNASSVIEFPVSVFMRNALAGSIQLRLQEKTYSFVPKVEEPSSDGLSRSPSQLGGVSRPVSSKAKPNSPKKQAPPAADKAKKGPPPAKGKKGAPAVNDTIEYNKVLSKENDLGVLSISLNPLTQGERKIVGDYNFSRVEQNEASAELQQLCIATLRASVFLHPALDIQEGAATHKLS